MKQFTAQQKEIVARKLGYDGPMQGFDDFVMSNPALQSRYNMLSGAFAEKMAKGGMVKRKKYATGGSVTQSKPSIKEFMDATGADFITASNTLYGNIGANIDARDWGAIMSSSNPLAAATSTTAAMYSDPAYQQANTANLVTQGYKPAQAYYTYGQMNERVGASYTPTPDEIKTVETYFKESGQPDYQWNVPQPSSTSATTTPVGSVVNGITAPANKITTAPATTSTTPSVDKITATGIDLGGNLADAPSIAKVPAPISPASGSASSASLTQASPAATTTLTEVAAPATVATPAPIVAPTAQAATSAEDVAKALEKLTPQQGAVSEQAQVTAVTKEPTTTAVSGLEAAQTQAAQVTGAPTRTVQEGEMVSGTAVDQARIDALMAQQQAAQGTVTAEMTVQGQLNQLLQSFDAGNPPPWAASSMRTATAQMAARGLSASSMAGQAIIQATLEAAIPIAAADAKVFETMGLQNLSNRQQMAVLVAQQRAQFLGQEFDQAFQTRVLNAAKISDIANKNFDAQTQIALENARLANSTNLANLSAKNALVLAEAAAMSQLETQNLSNLQQAAVENARAFLQMDMKNLDNRQQVEMFKAQSITNSLLQDASLQNAINITNATNALDAAKVSAQLKLTAETFNAGEQNKVALANANAANQLAQFNAQQRNAREQFNAEMANQISMANAKILADVSMANTAAANAAAIASAQNATQLTIAEYSQQSQTYRDMLEMSWKTGESEKDRVTEIAKATLTSNATTNAASATANVNAAAKIGALAFETVKNWSSVKAGVTDIGKTVSNWFGSSNTNVPGGSGWGLDLGKED